jgi:ATPase subunit of ABC transporter with duplicated ATPase domains
VFVRLDHVSFSYSDAVALLRDVTLQLAHGWTGMVGANGAGKTTLLRLVIGALDPSSGHVRVDPPALLVRYCEQTVERRTADIEALAAATDGESRRVTGELRLDPAALSRWPTMSPGERKRWQVGAALASEPGVLVLDEPSDHLDSEARDLLLAGLRRFRGIGIIVSHDRALLDELTICTIRVHDGAARIFRGGYSDAKRAWEAEERARLAEYERLKHERDVLRRRLADKRRMASAADSSISARSRMKRPRDHDATGMLARGKARAASARLSRDVGVVRASVERTIERLQEFTFRKDKGRALFVDYVAAPQARVLALDSESLSAGAKLLLEDVHVWVDRNAKIRLAGPNGIGKTTLLRELVAGARIPAERLLHLPQELADRDAAALLESVRELRGDERSRVLTLVAALGVDPERLLASRAPSPGEARKLALASGLGRQAWALVLDEPTNYLDIPAIERLEEALAEYPGALLVVTHDELLARRCTTIEWRLAERRVWVR